MQIAILGRQPKISIAELESLFGTSSVRPISHYASVIDTTQPLPQSRLGGTVKSATIITTLNNRSIDKAYEYINNNIANLANQFVPEGKIQFGISIYGFRLPKKSIFAKNLEIKKILRTAKRSIRIIENKSEELETAQVLHNKLATNKGIELLIVRDGDTTIIARTTGIQDIDAYSKRDQGRPKRDAKVGMLPPKLAQIIINLTNPPPDATVLDPFCGTGVLLQEATLMNLNILGTDLEPRIIHYTLANLQWLTDVSKVAHDKLNPNSNTQHLDIGDATTHNWQSLPNFGQDLVIACETYLGRPLSHQPSPSTLQPIMEHANHLHHKFLKNIGKQIPSGTKLCLAVPAWRKKNGLVHLSTLDQLDNLGYNQMSFAHATTEDMVYYRPDQVVARELVVLQKK